MPATEHARSSSAPCLPWRYRLRHFLHTERYLPAAIDAAVAYAERFGSLAECPVFVGWPDDAVAAESLLDKDDAGWDNPLWDCLEVSPAGWPTAMSEPQCRGADAILTEMEQVDHLLRQRPHVGPLSLPEHDAAIERAYGRLRDAMEAAR